MNHCREKKERQKKKYYAFHSPAFRAIETDRSAYLRVTTKWFHVVSLNLFSGQVWKPAA